MKKAIFKSNKEKELQTAFLENDETFGEWIDSETDYEISYHQEGNIYYLTEYEKRTGDILELISIESL